MGCGMKGIAVVVVVVVRVLLVLSSYIYVCAPIVLALAMHFLNQECVWSTLAFVLPIIVQPLHCQNKNQIIVFTLQV